MSKAILVLEMPEKCINCDISCQEDGSTDVFCTKMGCVSAYDKDDEKPDWCPLKKLPDEMKGIGSYACGWNDLLDMIGGGND